MARQHRFRARLALLASMPLAALLALVVVGVPTASASVAPPHRAPPEFVALSDVYPTIHMQIRYYTPHNFVGRPVRGYLEPECLLTRPAAQALHAAQQKFVRRGYTLKVYDCFRPQRAVDEFVRWAQRQDDQRMKAEFYPRVDKTALFDEGYIAEQSGHSRGSTMDLTVVPLAAAPDRPYIPGEPLAPCFAPVGQRFPDNGLDMGTGFDCFDTLAHTDDPRVRDPQRQHRLLLKNTMESVGFRNLPEEWWHFTLTNEPFPDTYFDFPVTRASLAS